jgi:hypothetical protein
MATYLSVDPLVIWRVGLIDLIGLIVIGLIGLISIRISNHDYQHPEASLPPIVPVPAALTG